MTRDVVAIGPELSVAQVVDEFFWRHHVSTFPVLDGGRVVGILGLDRVKQLPRERWAETAVRDAMLPLSDALTTAPDTSLWEAFEKLTRNGVGRLAVLDRDRLAGYLSIRDVVHILAVTGTGGSPLRDREARRHSSRGDARHSAPADVWWPSRSSVPSDRVPSVSDEVRSPSNCPFRGERHRQSALLSTARLGDVQH
jgi:CBS domain-containing protein